MAKKKSLTDKYQACFDRAWFLTLAHTGVRLSELLDLRLGDLNLAAGYATIRGGKPGRVEAIAVDDWPGIDVNEPAFAEIWTEGPA